MQLTILPCSQFQEATLAQSRKLQNFSDPLICLPSPSTVQAASNMTFLRPTSLRTVTLLRPAIARPALPIATTYKWFAHSGYGDGKGDPVGENPQKQPPAKSRDLEHPGPPAPDVGKGTDGTAPKSQNPGGEKKSASSSSKPQQQQQQKNSQSVKGAQPKILNENPPSEESPEVRQHNQEMENRAERAETKISNEDAEKDKVSPGFWSGKLVKRVKSLNGTC